MRTTTREMGKMRLFCFTMIIISSSMGCCCGLSVPLRRISKRNEPYHVIRARDDARHARVFRLLNFTLAGSANPYTFGLYYAKIQLGTPAQEFKLQIDTGSDVSWVSCKPCSNCPEAADFMGDYHFFNASASSSAALLPCRDRPRCTTINRITQDGCATPSNSCKYNLQYADGTLTAGYYMLDSLTLKTIAPNFGLSTTQTPFVFGCSVYQPQFLMEQIQGIDGILGLGHSEPSLISQLSSQGITTQVFAHCLSGNRDGGGALLFGEVVEWSLLYTPLVSSGLHYNIVLQSIVINGVPLLVDKSLFATTGGRETFIDSGTTLTYFISEAYDLFLSAVNSIVLKAASSYFYEGKQCYLVPSGSSHSPFSITKVFPEVRLTFAGGANMILKPEDYLMNNGFYNNGSGRWCLGIERSTSNATILGDIVLQNQIIVYDLARQHIGMAPYNCSRSVTLSFTSSKSSLPRARFLHIFSWMLALTILNFNV